jgi:protocatechuate 3,4-dioxygenase beta subunit
MREDNMPDLDENSITEVTLAQMAATPDPRLRRIMDAAVRHLHEFAREVELTPEEWSAGIAFLTAVGQKCTPYRQEFILLSDVLGLSSLLNLVHDGALKQDATDSSLLGPFYREGAPALALGETIARHANGPEIVLFGEVRDAEGMPVPHATIQVWQTSSDGLYDLQEHDPEVMDLRACFRADAEGRYHFRSIRPLAYPIPLDGPVGQLVIAQQRHGYRPAHIHFLIGAEGFRELVTALYLGDDGYIDSDTVFGVSKSLVVLPQLGLPGSPDPQTPAIRYDFTLARAVAGEGSGRVGSDPSRMMALATEDAAS